MRIADEAAREKPEGVVALINVVFLLLIFFLLVGTLSPAADLAVEHPETADSPAGRAPAYALYAAASGDLSYRGEAVALDRLDAAVASDAERPDDEPLSLVMDRALPARDVGAILAALSRGGIERVRLVTLRGER